MPLNPIRGSNYSRMHPGEAGIRRSPRGKKGTKRPCSHSLEAAAFFLLLCTVLASVSGGAARFCTSRKAQRGVRASRSREKGLLFLLMAKMTILSDLLINCLPAVTTANTQPSTPPPSCRAQFERLNNFSGCSHRRRIRMLRRRARNRTQNSPEGLFLITFIRLLIFSQNAHTYWFSAKKKRHCSVKSRLSVML